MKEINSSDLVVFSHLRWNFVFQRPQHLMSRFAKYRRVFFIEPPVQDAMSSTIECYKSQEGVHVVVPHTHKDYFETEMQLEMKCMLSDFFEAHSIENFTAWYYNPLSLLVSDHLHPEVVIFDCMDELSVFKDCPPIMKEWEAKLLKKSHVVFTGGHSLYKAKKHQHHNIHPFPSSIDHAHFKQSRVDLSEPDDQKDIPHPRIGFYGVIEERIDLDLLDMMAELRPEYQFIMVGPVIRIDESLLPRRENIHFLGQKSYAELPKYLASWDCAMMPFALNDATKFISPTKTPEFLAAGRPVVSTAINDVIHPYANPAGLVEIADSAHDFVEKIDVAMSKVNAQWLDEVDRFLSDNSWDMTFEKMAKQEMQIIQKLNQSEVFYECTGSAFTDVGGA